MYELTNQQVQQQDKMDNVIFRLLREKKILKDWNIEVIAEHRDAYVRAYTQKTQFNLLYPWVWVPFSPSEEAHWDWAVKFALREHGSIKYISLYRPTYTTNRVVITQYNHEVTTTEGTEDPVVLLREGLEKLFGD